jgi:N-acetylglutamate synthase-like GNAT family acetyltransferase
MGTAKDRQGRGIAVKLLQSLLKKGNKDVYLYTIIPDFFKKFGFGSAPLCSNLPARKNFNCEQCYPENCVCMCRKPELAI